MSRDPSNTPMDREPLPKMLHTLTLEFADQDMVHLIGSPDITQQIGALITDIGYDLEVSVMHHTRPEPDRKLAIMELACVSPEDVMTDTAVVASLAMVVYDWFTENEIEQPRLFRAVLQKRSPGKFGGTTAQTAKVKHVFNRLHSFNKTIDGFLETLLQKPEDTAESPEE